MINRYLILPLGLLIISILAASSMLIKYHHSGIAAYIVSLFLCTILFAIHKIDRIFLFLSFICLLTVYICISNLTSYLDLKHEKIIYKILPEDVNKYPDAAGFTFKDSVLRNDLKGENDFKIPRRPTRRVYAIPIMRKGQDKKKPVFVWAISNNNIKKQLNICIRAGGILFVYKEAVEMATKKYGLISHKNAVLVHLKPSLDKSIKESKMNIIDSILVMFFLWLIISIIFFLARIPVKPEKHINEN